MPAPRDHAPQTDSWLVYTDGSCKHERRQTFCGWAARAVQIQTRQVRQISGGGPGGDSLWAESEAIFAGLRLLPAGAHALLHSDLELRVLLTVLESPAGEAALAHLQEVLVQPVLRNTGAHQVAMHHASRTAEHDAREHQAREHQSPEEGAKGLRPGLVVEHAAQEMRELARSVGHETPLPRQSAQVMPGTLEPWSLRLEEVRFSRAGRAVRAQLDLVWPELQADGKTEREALQRALERLLTPLARASMVDLLVPAALQADTLSVAQRFPTVRLLTWAAVDRTDENRADGNGADGNGNQTG